jgi:hypothetical protein
LISGSDVGNQWYLNNEPVPGETDPILMPRKQGSYTVQVTIDGCRSGVSPSHLVIVTAVEEWASAVQVYPNPVAETLKINLASEMTGVKLSLTSAAGVPVRTLHVDAGSCEIDVSQLPAGIYMLQVEYKGKVNQYKVLRK